MFSRAITRLLNQQCERTAVQMPKLSSFSARTVQKHQQGMSVRTICMPMRSPVQAPITSTTFSSVITLHSKYALLMQRNTTMSSLRRMASSPPKQRKGASSRSPVTWISATVVLSLGAALVWYVRVTRQEQEEASERERKKSVGMPSIGGAFQLVDQDGKDVTQDDFLGKWVLIYFGFCHCPDICPDQLDKQAAIIDKVDAHARKSTTPIQPLFISVDPQRDDAAAVKEYIEEFHPRLIGLTGTVEQVKSACKTFRIYFSSGPADQDNDYIVDHSVVMYLLDPEGNFVTFFGQDKKVRDIVNDITFKMEGYN